MPAPPPPATDPGALVDRLRRICLALPGASERLRHGEPTFFAGRKAFVMFDNDHHRAGHVGFWCAAPEGAQHLLIEADPGQFFRPPYVGHRGWLGVRLDREPDWEEIAGIVASAHRVVAGKGLWSEGRT